MRRIPAERLPAALRGHLPSFLPDGFGLLVGFEETGLGEAIWSDERCRTVDLSFHSRELVERIHGPLRDGRGPLQLRYDKPKACGNSVLGDARCIEYWQRVEDGMIYVQLIGLDRGTARRIAESIRV